MPIVRKTLEQVPVISKQRLKELAQRADRHIDFSDIPELEDSFWDDLPLNRPEPKVSVALRLDRDVVDWFKAGGDGHTTRMAAVLRRYFERQSKAAG
jgi:uncharacterized protein (DUF4415 family)